MERRAAGLVARPTPVGERVSDLGPDGAALLGNPPALGESAGLTVLLGRAVAIVDRLWNEYRENPGDPLFAQLGEASRDIHRVLLAWGNPPGDALDTREER